MEPLSKSFRSNKSYNPHNPLLIKFKLNNNEITKLELLREAAKKNLFLVAGPLIKLSFFAACPIRVALKNFSLAI